MAHLCSAATIAAAREVKGEEEEGGGCVQFFNNLVQYERTVSCAIAWRLVQSIFEL